MNLDNYQKSVVTSKNNLLVIAGPGSGKTYTIIQKIHYLLENNETSILVLSFTNKSVDDLNKKITKNVYITTFHKLAIDILKYNHINYHICQTNLLDYITDEYFLKMNNKDINKICCYLNIKKFNTKCFEYNSIKKLIKSFINLYKTNNCQIKVLNQLIIKYNDKYFLNIILNIFKLYEEEKNSTNSLDFDDLIILATNILKNNYNYKKYKYIIIDEFQDTSQIRLELVKVIYENSKSIITAVGDDAQSIFHFAGCDLNIFLNFNKYFKDSKILYLKNTYRNSQELITISSSFVNKNHLQLKKNMISQNHEINPINIIYYYSKKWILVKALNKALKDSNDILILSRNNCDIYAYLNDKLTYKDGFIYYNNSKFRYLTIHSAKGLEADIVIILNLENSINGLPNKIENQEILSFVTAKDDTYPFSEERRVFFVAITRCKIKNYLLVSKNNPSIFIKEIKKML